jgi:hypothetical protein
MENKNINNVEKLQNPNVNNETNVQAVVKPAFWDKARNAFDKTVERFRDGYQKTRIALVPVRNFARWIARSVNSVINACVRLSIIAIALVLVSNFLIANPEIGTAISNFFAGLWDGVCDLPTEFLNFMKSIYNFFFGWLF